jgi:hypothetical protein
MKRRATGRRYYPRMAYRKNRHPVSVFVVGVLAASTLAAQQPVTPPATASGLIVGQVVDADSGRPIGESIVTLNANSAQALSPIAAAAAAQKVIADSNGRFVFRDLPKGSYSLTTFKSGYVTGVYGRMVPRGPGTSLELVDGERVIDAHVLMWQHAAITGRVVDEAGEPVVGAEIRVRRVGSVAGRPGFQSFLSGTILTDDRGVYRVSSLEPGRYVVGVAATSTTIPAPMIEQYFRATGAARAEMQQALFAAAPSMSSPGSSANQSVGDYILQVQGRMPTPPGSASGESPAVYAAVYYPQSARISEASPIVVKSGDTRAGIDIAIRAVASARVSGRLEGPAGAPGIATLFLLPAAGGDPVATMLEPAATTVSDTTGAFTFLGVPVGQYLLFAMKWPPVPVGGVSQVTVIQGPGGSSARGTTSEMPVADKPTFWALQNVAVGGPSVDNLPVPLQSGLRVSGSIVFEGPGQPPQVQRLSAFLEPTTAWLKSLSPGETTIASDGRFALAGAPAGRYVLTVPLPSGWFVKSAMSGGRDLSDLPFDLRDDLNDVVVTVSSSGARVSGTVRDRTGKADPSAGVLVYPADSRYWVDFSSYVRRIRETRAGRDGTFTLNDFPPGEYYIVAAAQSAIDWSSPDLLARLSQIATRVTLGPGEQKSIDLQTVQVR